MNVFITGASGYLGSNMAATLVARGHRVHGLARSDEAAERVRSSGAQPVFGSLRDLDRLAAAAASADVVIHTAATNDRERAVVDAAAVTAMLDAMSGGAFITTTGAPMARASRTPVNEEDTGELPPLLSWLAHAEARVLTAGHVRGLVVRPPLVYGDGAGPVAGMVQRARAEESSRYIGPGDNRWSMVHVRDLAVAYALLAESNERGVFHAAESEPVSMKDLFAAVGLAARVPVRSWSLEQALTEQGPLAGFLALDAALDARKLRSLGWEPRVGEALGGVCGALANPAQRYR